MKKNASTSVRALKIWTTAPTGSTASRKHFFSTNSLKCFKVLRAACTQYNLTYLKPLYFWFLRCFFFHFNTRREHVVVCGPFKLKVNRRKKKQHKNCRRYIIETTTSKLLLSTIVTYSFFFLFIFLLRVFSPKIKTKN